MIAYLRSSPRSPMARSTQASASSSENPSRCSISEAVAAGLLNQRRTAAASPGSNRRKLTSGLSLISQTLVRREAVAGRQQPEGAGEDAGVEGGASMVHVPDVQLYPLLPGDAG